MTRLLIDLMQVCGVSRAVICCCALPGELTTHLVEHAAFGSIHRYRAANFHQLPHVFEKSVVSLIFIPCFLIAGPQGDFCQS